MPRARLFDIDKAIQTATELFWRKGYEKTSLADLTAAIGITPPSFYFAFGSKDGLFKRVLQHYRETRLDRVEEALGQPTGRRVAEVMLHRLADLYTDPACPPGCLVVNCSLAVAGEPGAMKEEFDRLREQRRARLRDRLQTAKEAGDLASSADPDELAHYLMTVGWGLAHAARSGVSAAELHRTVERALQAWPA